MDILSSLLGGGVVAAVLLFIQYLINRHDEKDEKLSIIVQSINTVTKKIDYMEGRIDENNAIIARRSILRFGNELYNDIPHSQEMFDQVLDDIDKYSKYCSEHPDFLNSKTDTTVSFIKETYYRLYTEHKL